MVVINGKKFDLRSLRGQGRRSGQTCPPNRRDAFTNIKTLAGQHRQAGHRCEPTANAFDKRNRELRRSGRRSRRQQRNLNITDVIEARIIENRNQREDDELEMELREMLDNVLEDDPEITAQELRELQEQFGDD